MSRKMSARTRRLRWEQSQPGAAREAFMRNVCGTDFMMARSMPFRGNPIFNPDETLLKVRVALQGLLDRTMASDDPNGFDVLVCAIGEAKIRYMDIAGPDCEPMLLLDKSDEALIRAYERWKRTSEWGLDGPGIQALKDGISLFEEVFLASSPNQMTEAENTYRKWVKMQRQGKISGKIKGQVVNFTGSTQETKDGFERKNRVAAQ